MMMRGEEPDDDRKAGRCPEVVGVPEMVRSSRCTSASITTLVFVERSGYN